MAGYGGGGGRQPEPTKYLFVDGAYLYRTFARISDRYFGGVPLKVDYNRLADGARKVFYYDCLPGRRESDPDEAFKKRVEDRTAFFQRLRGIRGWHVQLGSIKGEGDKLRQKQVDTMLSVDMLAHSYRRNASEISLIAGDLDFKPAVDALVQDGMYVVLHYDKSHVSSELMASADDRRPIDIHSIRNWLEEGFKETCEIPTPHINSEEQAPGQELFRQGRFDDGKVVKLYKVPDGYWLMFDHDDNRNQKLYVKGKSAEVVEKFTEDVFRKVTWS